jgi:thiamine biosynthesis lipoprotein
MTVVVQPRQLNVRKTLFVATILVGFFVYTYVIRQPLAPANLILDGSTMGTTYTIKVVDAHLTQRELRALSGDITSRLADINRQMSTYIPDSEISRFNQSTSTAPVPVSAGFALVTRKALEISHDTDGAFDPTLGPLINLWGFGHKVRESDAHTPAELTTALASCGYRHLTVTGDGSLRKDIAQLELNLSAIAKGYGVDVLSDLLAERSLTNTYVEIGGELRVRGHNLEGNPWRIGIDTPADHAAVGENVSSVLALRDRAVATSGDYRNYYEDAGGARRSHLIDPRTGMPIAHRLASATVIAPDCMTADAVATALMVVGPDQAQAWIKQYPDLETILIVRTNAGFETLTSAGVAELAQDPP